MNCFELCLCHSDDHLRSKVKRAIKQRKRHYSALIPVNFLPPENLDQIYVKPLNECCTSFLRIWSGIVQIVPWLSCSYQFTHPSCVHRSAGRLSRTNLSQAQ